MKGQNDSTKRTRGIVLDTLFYEIYLAPLPADPHWAARAIEALDDAGLLDREELEELELRFCRARGELAAQRAAGGARE